MNKRALAKERTSNWNGPGQGCEQTPPDFPTGPKPSMSHGRPEHQLPMR